MTLSKCLNEQQIDVLIFGARQQLTVELVLKRQYGKCSWQEIERHKGLT